MLVFSKSFHLVESEGSFLRLKHRPSLLMIAGCAGFVLLGLVCLMPMEWGSLFVAFVMAFPGLMMAPIVWEEWQEVVIPSRGGVIQWRDGLKRGELGADRVRAVMVDYDVTPKLHKGAGRTAYVRVWAADGEKVDAGVCYPWIYLFSYAPDPYGEPVDQVVKRLQQKIEVLGYTMKYNTVEAGQPSGSA